MFFWKSLAFSMFHQMRAIWSLVFLPFLNPPWISGSSQFIYCWSRDLKNFEYYYASMWNEWNECGNLNILQHCLFFGIGMKTDVFQSCGHCWIFQICWHIECSTFRASYFRIWNSSTGIPSPPLALFVVMLPKAHLTSIPGCLALGEWSHHCDYLGHEDLFCRVILCILVTSS